MALSISLVIFTILLIISLFVTVIIRRSMERVGLLPTPSIPVEKAVFTSFASTKIKGNADEVFKVLVNYGGYSTWSPFSAYKWDNAADDGSPVIGSLGTFKLSIEDFDERIIPVKLTLFDKENRKVSEVTTKYPGWLLASERVQEVIPVEGEPHLCEYRTFHTLRGIASYYLLLTSREDLLDSQRRCASDLKDYIELGQK